MDDLERRQTEMVFRVDSFGDENKSAIQTFQKAVAAFAAGKTGIEQLAARGISRTSSGETKLSLSARRKMMRHEIYLDLSLIADTARDIERNEESFVNKFRLPKANRSDLVWLETAKSFAADLVSVKQLFLDYATADDFLEDLTADTADFEQAIGGQDTSNRDRIAADADIDDILGSTLKAIRTLKVIVPNIFKGNPGKLADWAKASHVEKPVKKPQPPKP